MSSVSDPSSGSVEETSILLADTDPRRHICLYKLMGKRRIRPAPPPLPPLQCCWSARLRLVQYHRCCCRHQRRPCSPLPPPLPAAAMPCRRRPAARSTTAAACYCCRAAAACCSVCLLLLLPVRLQMDLKGQMIPDRCHCQTRHLHHLINKIRMHACTISKHPKAQGWSPQQLFPHVNWSLWSKFSATKEGCTPSNTEQAWANLFDLPSHRCQTTPLHNASR